MAKKQEKTIEKVTRDYVIPIRKKSKSSVIYKKTPKAIRVVKEFLARHMQIRDRDLRKIKLDNHVNEFLWARGIKNPPHKIKVKVVKEGENVMVSLFDMSKKAQAKQARLEKRESGVVNTKEAPVAKAPTKVKQEDADKDGVNDKKEESEKKKSVEDEAQKESKEEAKSNAKTTKIENSEQKAKEGKSGKAGSA